MSLLDPVPLVYLYTDDKIRPCPYCESKALSAVLRCRDWAVECALCGARGPIAIQRHSAIELFFARGKRDHREAWKMANGRV